MNLSRLIVNTAAIAVAVFILAGIWFGIEYIVTESAKQIYYPFRGFYNEKIQTW